MNLFGTLRGLRNQSKRKDITKGKIKFLTFHHFSYYKTIEDINSPATINMSDFKLEKKAEKIVHTSSSYTFQSTKGVHNVNIPIAVMSDPNKVSSFRSFPNAKKISSYGEFRSPFGRGEDQRTVFFGIR